jgi:hypothetical protein
MPSVLGTIPHEKRAGVSVSALCKEDEDDPTSGSSFCASSCSLGNFFRTGVVFLGTFPRRDDSEFEGDDSGNEAVFLGTIARRDNSVLPTIVFLLSNSTRVFARS